MPAELLEGLPRWSVLLGYVTPVDGVWRAGGGFVAADPLTGRVAAHELLDGIMDSLDPEDPDSRGLLGWAEDLHERAHPLALPDDGERLTAEAFWLYQSLVRSAAPGLAEIIRGSAPVEDGPTAARTLDGLGVSWSARDDLGKVSVVGAGMKSHPGIAARVFATLEEQKIEPVVVSTSPIKIACHVATADVDRAVQALHEAFDLG